MENLMEFKGFKASIMEAERLTGEREHGLPPGSPLPVYSVKAFKKHPKHWMEEDGCFVVPVKANKGLWFDWTMNDSLNTAVIPTVKGCNPITGMRTNGFALERYEKRCPIHDKEFIQDRYCEECGYKWPVQNYISPPNICWWDGFRDSSGLVRQFFFTEDMMRDIASHLIGKEDTVPAFGFAFYSQKTLRIPQSFTLDFFTGYYAPPIYNTGLPPYKPLWYYNGTFNDSLIGQYPIIDGSSDNIMYCNSVGTDDIKRNCVNEEIPDYEHLVESLELSSDRGIKEVKSLSFNQPIKEVAVGAGAKIKQGLLPDNYEFDSWKDEPDSVMRIYFVFQNEFDHWTSFGIRDFSGYKDGMLKGLPVG